MSDEASFTPEKADALDHQLLAERVVSLIEHTKAHSVPEIYRKDRIHHGIALGLNQAVHIMTGVEPPKLGADGYHDEKASDKNLGHEALRLLAEITSRPHTEEEAKYWTIKAKQLLEVWAFNTRGEAVTDAIKEMSPRDDRTWCRLRMGAMTVEAFRMEDILSAPTVSAAMRDRDGMEFICLAIIERGAGNELLLAAQHVLAKSTGVDQKSTIIGVLDRIPKWMNLRRISQ